MHHSISNRATAYVLACVVFAAQSLVGAPESSGVSASPVGLPRTEDFTYLWWANGPQHYLDMKGPAPAAVLCFQSGTLGFALDTKSLRVLHAGRFPRPFDRESALKEGRDALQSLPVEVLELRVARGTTTFRCVGRGDSPKDEFLFPVRFVESGRLFQCVTIEGLEFTDDTGRKLESRGRAELAFWPDRLICSLELATHDAVKDGELTLAFGGRTATVQLKESRRVTIELLASRTERPTLDVADGANASWTPALGAWVVRMPTRAWKNSKGTYYPEEELDRLDRWRFSLRNETDREAVAPIVFIPEPMHAITGLTPMLCDPDGTPTGLFVQLSKNWHSRKEKGEVPHQGQWFHGCAFLRVPPKASRELVFAITYARWGGVPAASHTQLCLMG
jgi:hypothetical protein